MWQGRILKTFPAFRFDLLWFIKCFSFVKNSVLLPSYYVSWFMHIVRHVLLEESNCLCHKSSTCNHSWSSRSWWGIYKRCIEHTRKISSWVLYDPWTRVNPSDLHGPWFGDTEHESGVCNIRKRRGKNRELMCTTIPCLKTFWWDNLNHWTGNIFE